MKLTTERLKQIIREELNKMTEADRKKLPFDMLTYGPAMGYIKNQMRAEPEKKEKDSYKPPSKYNNDPIPDHLFPSEKAAAPMQKTAAEIATELKNSNLIVNVLDDSTVRIKLKDGSGKYINKDFHIGAGTTPQSIIDQISQEYPDAMMQASERGMKKGGDMVDIQDPMMELRKRFLKI